MAHGCCRYLLTAVFICLLQLVQAQVPEESDSGAERIVLVELSNGTEYIGNIVSQDKRQITIKLKTGEEKVISMTEVSSITYIKPDAEDPFYYNMQAARYFFGPNGYGLKQGEGYYQNSWIFINQVSYGFNDYFTVGIGVIPMFIFGVATPVFVTPKFSVPIVKDAVNVGAGGLFGIVLGENSESFGAGYGALTLGNRNANINFSMGYTMLDGDWNRRATFSVSGMVRPARRFYLLSENYFFPQLSVFSFGGRSIFRSGPSLDYGLIYIHDNFDGDFAPWLGLTIPFKSN